MVYHADGMELEVIWEAFRGSVNDVSVCRNRNSSAGTCYTLLSIHDRSCIKTVLDLLDRSDRNTEDACLLRFSHNEQLCFLFEYRPERHFSAFAHGQMRSPGVGEEICVNLVMECLSYPLPWPLLYLVLTQDNIHIAKDNGIYFTPLLDLSMLNPAFGEDACVSCCARILLEFLSGAPAGGRPSRKKLKSFELIRKKSEKHAYSGFPELYRDIKVTALPPVKAGFWARLRGFWARNKDTLFRIFLVLCILTVVLAVIVLISQLIFGDVPLFRLFQNSFDVIGTENLHK